MQSYVGKCIGPNPTEEGSMAIPKGLQLATIGTSGKSLCHDHRRPRKNSAARWGPKGSFHLQELPIIISLTPAALSHSILKGHFCRLNYILPKCMC